jgi:hypothetical protein
VLFSLAVVTKVVSPRTKPKESVGPRVVVYWLDRQTGNRVVEPMSVHLDGHSMLNEKIIETEKVDD